MTLNLLTRVLCKTEQGKKSDCSQKGNSGIFGPFRNFYSHSKFVIDLYT